MINSQTKLPLYDFFTALRQKGAHLGIDNYELLIQALQSGHSIDISPTANSHQLANISRKQLLYLCKVLWLKPGRNENDFEELFDYYFTFVPSAAEEEAPITETSTSEEPDASDSPIQESDPNPQVGENQPMEEDAERQESRSNEKLREIEVSLGTRKAESEQEISHKINQHKFLFSPNYLPFSIRHMKQEWNFIEERFWKGKTDEIDIPATVEGIAKEGMLLRPHFRKKENSRAFLTTFIDYGGSMTAFHPMAELLAGLATIDKEIENEVFYFYNLPRDELLYTNTAHTDSIWMDEWLEGVQAEVGRKRAVLIISDAGAARGHYDPDRVSTTVEWIDQIRQLTPKVAWLNPMPRRRWQATTAYGIAQHVPMYEISPTEIHQAINVLRGLARI